MIADLIEDCKAAVLRHFPERQIYLRSGGEVSYHTLTTRLQVGAVSALALMSLWCGVTFINAAWGHNPLAPGVQKAKSVQYENQRLLEDAEARYADAMRQLDEQQAAFEATTRNFEVKHAALAQFVSRPVSGPDIPLLDTLTHETGQVIMSPVVRDSEPRTSRTNRLSAMPVNTGTQADDKAAALQTRQNTALLMAELAAGDKIEFNRAVIEATGMNVSAVLASDMTGTGGPLAGASALPVPDAETPDKDRINGMSARAEELQRLDMALSAMPIGHPVNADHYKTSSFGMRKDPFTKRPAHHSAVDIASYHMAPIVATGDGKVSFVGRRGGYGRVVEIDHGYGFKTRYAHLAKTFVKRGQDVVKGDKIGGMGSSGRSTSTHLHYEVQFQGRRHDPENFMKAGRYVQ